MRPAVWAILGVGVLIVGVERASRADERRVVTRLRTPDGIEFGLLGPKPASPVPTLFVFAMDLEGTLTDAHYSRAGHLLAEQGFVCVALDLPCHGKDNKEEEKNPLVGWRRRIERGAEPIRGFTAQCARVLDFLIEGGYTDPERVAACGTSRGGFVALHFAAAEPRVRCAVAFAPVTDLMALREFQGIGNVGPAHSLVLAQVAEKLAGRPLWVCIGNDDRRVGTDEAIAFTRRVVQAAVAQQRPARVDIDVMASPGHSVHPTAHPEAAAWIAARLQEGRRPDNWR